MGVKLVGVNERGLRVGEDHPRATLTDSDVELMRQLHEDKDKPLGYRALARIFEAPRSTVQSICTYQTRCQAAVRFRQA